MSSAPEQKQKHYIADELEEDLPYSGSKFVGISFLSPEKILKQKEIFLFEKYIDNWDFNKSMRKFNDFLHFISEKFNIKIDVLLKDYEDFLKDEEADLRSESVLEDYKNFLDLNEEKMTEKFDKLHEFQTSVRGLKIRTPTVGTQEECEMLVKKVRERDPHHDIYIGEVGKWMPWDPEAYKTGRVDYLEPELNKLHNAKAKNEELAKIEFDKRIQETKRKAIMENIELAKKNNNVLTQSMDENGNLVGVVDKINFEEREPATAEMKELQRKELLDRINADNK
jgi:hypothetical protein